MNRSLLGRRLCAIAACVAIAFSAELLAQPTSYPTAEAAADALVGAIRSDDKSSLGKVLGNDWKDYIPVDDIDRDDVDAFLAKYEEKHSISSEGGTSHLVVGQGWVLPMPMVKGASGWTFDLVQARKEILVRHIGSNELSTLRAMLAYYDAQRDYATEDRNGDGVLEYAQKLRSTAGKRDGLFWETEGDEPLSPLGPAFVNTTPGEAYYGYAYRILTAQGPSAPGGAYDYVIGKRMRSGFAIVAWPVRYAETGVMTFMVSHDGIVFQKDLGENTAKNVESIKRFDPDSSWQEISEND